MNIQALFETIFDIAYLGGVILLGISMLRTTENNKTRKLFGIMAIILGSGDAFHLIPRAIALWGSGLEAHAVSLGIGKLITSITMTIFYVILYYVWRSYYEIEGRKNLTVGIWVLALVRVALCALPQNEWLSYNPPLLYGVLRNIPFAILGILIIVIFAQEHKKTGEKYFTYMPLAIALSFGFYIPVVLFSSVYPLVGMLMIPKTLAYVWIVVMGFRLPKKI